MVDAITLAYEAQGVLCPLRLRTHSTRGVALSGALARGASLADICRAVGWVTPNTFASFYSLRVEPIPPVFSPQTGSGTERPGSELLVEFLIPEFSREFPDWANYVKSSSSPVARRGEASGARRFSQWILEIWCEASAHMSDPVGIPYVFSMVFLLKPCFPRQTTFCCL